MSSPPPSGIALLLTRWAPAPPSHFLQKPQRPSTPPHGPSPAGPRALQLSPLGEPPRRRENPARPPLSAAGRVPSHRGGGRPAGRADGERPGTVWLGNAVTAPAPEPGPSEAPARASCQSAGRARPRPRPRPRLRRRGAAREWRHVMGRCSCRRLALRRVSAHVPRLSGLRVAPRREASSCGPGSTLGDFPRFALTEGPRNPVCWICSKLGCSPRLGRAGWAQAALQTNEWVIW